MTSDPPPVTPPADPTEPTSGPAVAAVLFVAVFALLLASFPARNQDVWAHLADGRETVALVNVSPSWLYDLGAYAVFRSLGGAGLVGVKAAAVVGLAVLLLRVSRAGGNRWLLPVVCTALAVLAMGNRLLLQPAAVSYLFLGLTVSLVHRDGADDAPRGGVWPGWALVVLFVVWANVDRWVVLGLGTVALAWFGREFDRAPAGERGRRLLRRAGAVAVLAAAACVSPSHVNGLRPPAELAAVVGPTADAAGGGPKPITSPFDRAYLAAFGGSPAALAYYPLLGLSALSFLLVRSGLRWERFLPWLGLAVVSAAQARAVPFFAVVAGPVLAWNLRDFFARRPHPGPRRRAARVAVRGSVALLAVVALVCVWPGWLQGPPFEPRRWAVEPPAALEQAAAAVRRGHQDGVFPPGTRTLHLTADTADAFAWFCPEDPRVNDDALTADLVGAADPAALDDRLRAAGVTRVIVRAADRGPARPALERLLAGPDRWPLLHLGGVVVFGWRDPDRAGADDPFRGREVDFDRLAFRPADGEKAPAAPPTRAGDRRWWDVFWRPAPPRSADRDEASVLLVKADVLRRSALVRHVAEWEAAQAAGLAAAGVGRFGPDAPADAALRFTLFRPPVPAGWKPGRTLPPISQATFALQRHYILLRGDVPPGVLYAAVRAARRAVATNPADAGAHLLLGKAYLQLLTTTCERGWAARLPQLARLRQVQASAALNRAVALNPGLADAHLELGLLYQQLGCLDLAVTHLRAYHAAAARAGGTDPGGSADLTRLAEAVDRETRAVAEESARTSVADRAALAVRRGLGGRALAVLLESDISAFGAPGMRLELDLLLKTGRCDDVVNWTTPELEPVLGSSAYHWLRAQALAAAGEYAAADAELADLAGRPATPDDVAASFARLAGRAVLDEQPGLHLLPQQVWRVLGRNEFLSGVGGVTRGLIEQADAATVRGLVAVEAGEIDRARSALRTALAFSGDRAEGGGLWFGGRSAARTCLNWIDASRR